MKVMPLSEVKAKLSKLVDEVAARDEEIVITRNGDWRDDLKRLVEESAS